MAASDDEFLKMLRATFRVEAAEHLETIAAGLLELEKSPAPEAQRRLVESVFRAAHSLKGAARAVDFTAIETHCQSLEDVFSMWKRPGNAPSLALFDRLHQTLNAITEAMAAPETPRHAAPPPAAPVFAPPPPVRPPAEFPPLPPFPPAAPPRPSVQAPPPKSAAGETVRIAVAKLDARLVEAEEMLAAKLLVRQHAEDLRELAHRFEGWRHEWSAVEPAAHTLRQTVDHPKHVSSAPAGPELKRLLDFLDWNRDQLKSLEEKVAALARVAGQDRHVVGKLVDDLLEDSKKLLLLPFATLTASFPKLVRDLCREQGKEAEFVVRGEEVEIDKRILEEMKDPLIHLLRNCVDHGVETPEARVRDGKPGRATITLAVSSVNGSKVELLVADDGAGIDTEKVRLSAVKHGLLSAQEAERLDEAAAQALVFQPEVSTSPLITRLSGRGLGMAIVREKAEKLGGTVSVESRPGQGTRSRLVLPSMLATFRGILVEAAGRLLVVPTLHVERVARVRAEEIRTVEGRETIALNGRAIALVRLATVLELPPVENPDAPPAAAAVPVLVLGLGDQCVAFLVDAVLDEQEVLVKPLRKPLLRVRNIAGATVLGSGQVAPILNVSDLFKSARKSAGAAVTHMPAAAEKKSGADTKSILVAEDSITSRLLIKSILESAGYTVKTAVDGLEAFTILRAEKFDLVVSDVEMPRLNGFDLTARVRADRKLAELPVILVTALETREDRERGIDVGASAYLVKSNFEQGQLLDAIRRLV